MQFHDFAITTFRAVLEIKSHFLVPDFVPIWCQSLSVPHKKLTLDVVVVGICSMALLSGFASVSSPWHTLLDRRAHRRRPVTESDIRRKEAGLDATTELLIAKRQRLQLLHNRAAAAAAAAADRPTAGLLGRLVGSIRHIGSGGDAAEIQALQMEVAGLEVMATGVSDPQSDLGKGSSCRPQLAS